VLRVGRRLTLAFASVVVVGSAGCNSAPDAYACTSSATCTINGMAGTCEPSGFCSFPDPSCGEGRRYGEFSGPHSNQCVGQLDDAGVADATSCGSMSLPNDRDCDGVVDGQDNCPSVSNPNQDNEDGDRFGDACDPCPPVADDNPPDSDGDGVADACDPNPTTPGDHIFLFEGFHHGVPSGWEVVGAWAGSGDDLVTDNTTGTTAVYVSTPGPTIAHETISAAFTVNTATMALANAGVLDDHAVGGTYMGCGPYWYMNANGLDLHDTGTATYNLVGFEMTVGATYNANLRQDLTTFTCVATNTASNATAMISTTDTLANTPPSIGIFATGSSINFHWLMVVANN